MLEHFTFQVSFVLLFRLLRQTVLQAGQCSTRILILRSRVCTRTPPTYPGRRDSSPWPVHLIPLGGYHGVPKPAEVWALRPDGHPNHLSWLLSTQRSSRSTSRKVPFLFPL